MKEIDFERALLLMSVIKEVSNTAPQNQAILGAAQTELREIEKDAYDNQQELAEQRRQEEAQRAEAEGMRLRAEHQQPDVDGDGVEDPGDGNDGDEDEDEPQVTRRA